MDLAPLDPRQAFRISEDELPPSEAEDSEAPTLADGADENNPPAQRANEEIRRQGQQETERRMRELVQQERDRRERERVVLEARLRQLEEEIQQQRRALERAEERARGERQFIFNTKNLNFYNNK
jgi:hypothetical protein